MSENEFNPNSNDAVMARIETKLDTALDEQKKHREEIESLKTWRAYTVGLSTAAAAFVNLITGGKN